MLTENPAYLFLGFLLAERGLEVLIARRNERWIRVRGGIEHGRAFTRVLILFHALWFAGFFLEATLRRQPLFVPLPWFIALVVVLQAGRYWCIVSLGRYWNTKILVLPGAALARRGPYRWLQHPNYWVVRLEMFVYPAIFGCWWTAMAGGAINLWIVHKRIQQEEEALAAKPAGSK